MFDFMKTTLNAVKHYVDTKFGNLPKPNWNQNDSNAPDYIKNRPFYEDNKEVLLVNNLTSDDYFSEDVENPICNFVVDNVYKVIWNDVVYDNLVCYLDDGYNVIASSNHGCPFYIDDDGGDALYIESDNEDEAWTVSIIEYQKELKKIDEKYLPDDIGVQSDWSVNDEDNPAYVSNRPFYDNKIVDKVAVPETTINVTEGDRGFYLDCTNKIEVGQNYIVTLDGIPYLSSNVIDNEGSIYCNITTNYGSININTYPWSSEIYFYTYSDTLPFSGEHTISVEIGDYYLKTINEKYLPKAYATMDFAKSIEATAKTAKTTADSAKKLVDSKMDKENPVGRGSITLGTDASSTGKDSISIGHDVVSNRKHTTVLGSLNIIDEAEYGVASASFDYETRAIYSGREFYVGTGYSLDTKTGVLSLIKPKLITVDKTVCPNGSEFYACATSEANPNHPTTIYATDEIKWKSGYFDTMEFGVAKANESKGEYIIVVGNGSYYRDVNATISRRSNAHTLDWKGNAWYQGDVYVGGDGQDDSKAVKLIKSPTTAEVGQTIVVKSVDEKGKPTEWECVDMANFGGNNADILFVKCSYDSDTDTLSIDKTYDEIEEVKKLKPIFLIDETSIYTYTGYGSANSLVFEKIEQAIASNGDIYFSKSTIEIHQDNTVTDDYIESKIQGELIE